MNDKALEQPLAKQLQFLEQQLSVESDMLLDMSLIIA
jgi:hypothetical protein